MTRHNLGAALYAPLRVALFETESGEVVFEYDKPSTLFGQIGDERVTEVGLYLDRELEAALIKAAGRRADGRARVLARRDSPISLPVRPSAVSPSAAPIASISSCLICGHDTHTSRVHPSIEAPPGPRGPGLGRANGNLRASRSPQQRAVTMAEATARS